MHNKNSFLNFLIGELGDAKEDLFDHLEHLHWFQNKKNIQFLTGHNKQKEHSTYDTIKVHKQEKEEYPSSFDWRAVGEAKKNFINPRVLWQGCCPSCVAYGTAAAVEAYARIDKDIPVGSPEAYTMPDLSEAQLFFCSPGDKEGGWYVADAMQFCKEVGVAPNRFFPWDYHAPWNYDEQKCDLKEGWQDTVTKINDYHWLDTHDEMKQWISKKGPLLASMDIHLDFLFCDDEVYKKSDAFWNFDLGGHCVLCIGYDDEKQAWLCKNSWSDHWGDHGYFWIAYNECDIDDRMMAINGFTQIYQENKS